MRPTEIAKRLWDWVGPVSIGSWARRLTTLIWRGKLESVPRLVMPCLNPKQRQATSHRLLLNSADDLHDLETLLPRP